MIITNIPQTTVQILAVKNIVYTPTAAPTCSITYSITFLQTILYSLGGSFSSIWVSTKEPSWCSSFTSNTSKAILINAGHYWQLLKKIIKLIHWMHFTDTIKVNNGTREQFVDVILD